MTTAPTLFLSHGAPTFALEPGRLGPLLNSLGKQLAHDASGIKAVLVISPHWQTRNVRVMTTARPETVHDFGGFPSALYALHYPASGEPHYAAEAIRLLTQAGFVDGADPGDARWQGLRQQLCHAHERPRAVGRSDSTAV